MEDLQIKLCEYVYSFAKGLFENKDFQNARELFYTISIYSPLDELALKAELSCKICCHHLLQKPNLDFSEKVGLTNILHSPLSVKEKFTPEQVQFLTEYRDLWRLNKQTSRSNSK